MAGRRVSNEQAREHEARAWALRQQGWTEARIGRELGVSQPAVSKILARVSARVLRDLAGEVGRRKAEQSALLEHVVDEAMQGWERSKQAAQSVVKKTTPGSPGPDGKARAEETVTMTVEGQVGDVAYLDEARAALADLRKLWGLDAPQKVEHGGRLELVGLEFAAQEDTGAGDGGSNP